MSMSRKLPKNGNTFLFQLNVTRQCNIRCTHCYISSEKKNISPNWSESDFLHVVKGITDFLRQDMLTSQRYNAAEIHVIGGEPTELGEEFFDSVLPKATAFFDSIPHRIEFSLCTNLISEKSLNVSSKFSKVSTSYEVKTRFLKKKHEEMWKNNVIRLFDSIANRTVNTEQLSIACCITKPAVDLGAEAVIKDLLDLGFRHIHFGFFIPSGDGEANRSDVEPTHEETSQFYIDCFNWYMENKHKYPGLLISPMDAWVTAIKEERSQSDVVCPIITGSLDVDGDGETISCIEKGGVVNYKSNGNVLEKIRLVGFDTEKDNEAIHYQRNISDILKSPSYIREVSSALYLPEICQNCEEQHVCKANCSVLHQHWDQDGECPGFKRFIKHVRSYVESRFDVVAV